jgi:hypothetical protein
MLCSSAKDIGQRLPQASAGHEDVQSFHQECFGFLLIFPIKA